MSTLSIGYGSFIMPIKDDWSVTYFEEDRSKAEVRFVTGQYPVLGIKVLSIDDPKLDKGSDLRPHLFDKILLETNPDLKILKIKENTYGLEYEANLESGEKAKVWRIGSRIGARRVRIVTLALSWMSGEEADKVVNNLLSQVHNNVRKCNFPDTITQLDNEAGALAKISRLKFKTINPWKGLNINLPSSWLAEINEKDKSMALKVTGYSDTMLFLNHEEIQLSKTIVLTMDYMQQIASNLSADPDVKNISLHSTEGNMYLISCSKSEEVEEEKLILKNCFWHFFMVNENTGCF